MVLVKMIEFGISNLLGRCCVQYQQLKLAV